MNIRCFIFLLCCCLMGGGCYAQYFSKLYTDGHPTMLFGSIKMAGGNLYVTGVTTAKQAPYYQKAVFGKLDGQGNLVFLNSIIDTDSLEYDNFANDLKKTSDGNFVTTGYELDSPQMVVLMKVDTNGNVLLWREYSDSGNIYYQGMDVAEVKGSGYLICVNLSRENYSPPGNINLVRVIRTDTLGNVLNSKDYPNGAAAIPQIIRPMYNGHYMVGAWIGPQFPQDTPYITHTWLIEVDSMANEIREWEDPDPTDFWTNGMEQTADSGWILVRPHLVWEVPGYQGYDGSILKLDKNFNKQWEIDTGGDDQIAGMYDVKILSDGNYICAGANPIDINQDSSHIYGWLMKISKAGEIIWQRFYLADSTFMAFNYLTSIDTIPGGGFVACGYVESNVTLQDGWIIKTDSNGCLLENCGREVTLIDNLRPPQFAIKYYPNPVNDILHIQSPQLVSTVTISDLSGRYITRYRPGAFNFDIPVGNLAGGTYLFIALAGNQPVTGKFVKIE